MTRFWGALQETAPPFQQVFHDLLGGRPAPSALRRSPLRPALRDRRLGPVIDGPGAPSRRPRTAALTHPYSPDPAQTMLIDEVEAIWAAIAEATTGRPSRPRSPRSTKCPERMAPAPLHRPDPARNGIAGTRQPGVTFRFRNACEQAVGGGDVAAPVRRAWQSRSASCCLWPRARCGARPVLPVILTERRLC